jgi:hypothetical protein
MLRVAHRVHSLNNNRPERNQNCVTYVVGQNCYLCCRLLKVRLAREDYPTKNRPEAMRGRWATGQL